MKRAFLFLVTAAMLLLDTSPLWTQGELISLEVIWEKNVRDLQFSEICKQNSLLTIIDIHTKPLATTQIFDLKRGVEIFRNNPETQSSIAFNFWGSKFYILDYIAKQWKEYDIETTNYIQDTYGVTGHYTYFYLSPDNAFFHWDGLLNTIFFRDLYTNQVLDELTLPNKPSSPFTFNVSSPSGEFSVDGRYMIFSLHLPDNKGNPGITTTYIYDRQTRETIQIPVNRFSDKIMYHFFNRSNKIVFGDYVRTSNENIKIVYMRIFDLDTRTFEKDIELGPSSYVYFVLSEDDSKILYLNNNSDQNGYAFVYDLENDKLGDYKFNIRGIPLLLKDNTLYTWSSYYLTAYKLDMIMEVQDETNLGEQILYPNPAIEYIEIIPPLPKGDSELASRGIYDVKIFNMLGECVITTPSLRATPSEKGNLRIDVSQLPTGVYYISMGNKFDKFVVVR